MGRAGQATHIARRLSSIGAGPGLLVDRPRLADHARQVRFVAKLCIHPKQAGAVNRCFTPGPDELAWAGRVPEAAARAGGAAVALDGKMIDRPVILRAQATVDVHAQRAGLADAVSSR